MFYKDVIPRQELERSKKQLKHLTKAHQSLTLAHDSLKKKNEEMIGI